MAARIHELRQQRADLAKAANVALEAAREKAKTEKRVLTADEIKAQDDYDAQLSALDQDIKLEERSIERAKIAGTAPRTEDPDPRARARVRQRAEDDTRRRGFKSHREFLLAVMAAEGAASRDEIEDERLRPLAVMDKEDKMAQGRLAFMLPIGFSPLAAAGSDEQGGYDDQYGGFGVPRTFIPDLLKVGLESDPTDGRTQDVPMQTPMVEIPARTDKDHTSSVTGGFTFSRKPEAAAANASRFQMELVALKAASLFGLAYATEEILVDSPLSFAAIIAAGFRDQLPAHMLNEKLRGKGGNEYLGLLTALDSSSLGPTVSVAKETGQVATTIVAANVLKMRSRCWGFGQAIWLANHDTYPQLATMAIGVGTAGILVYQQSLIEDRPDTLCGRPIFYTEFASTLGAQGDLILSNWSQYLEGLYQPLQSAESVHVRFVNHERAFKFWLRNAGAPWWRTPLTPNKSTSKLSPFVVLDAR